MCIGHLLRPGVAWANPSDASPAPPPLPAPPPRLPLAAGSVHVCICDRTLQRTIYAMQRVGIPDGDQQAIFRTVAAVLQLGNIAFVPGPEDRALVDPASDTYLDATGEAVLVLEERGGGGTRTLGRAVGPWVG